MLDDVSRAVSDEGADGAPSVPAGAGPLSLVAATCALSFALGTGASHPVPAPDLGEISSSSVADAELVESYRACERALARVLAALERTPVEDGIDHEAEGLLGAFVAAFGDHPIEATIAAGDALGADLIRITSRRPASAAFRRKVVALGLTSDAMEMQDAAIQAAENWGDPALAPLLAARSFTPGWLDDYRAEVCAELRG